MSNTGEKMNSMKEHTHEMPGASKGDHGKSKPNAGTGQRSKDHGMGYPLTIPSIDHSMPAAGVTDRGNGNEHGHTYPGRPYPGKGPIKNAHKTPSRKAKNIVG